MRRLIRYLIGAVFGAIAIADMWYSRAIYRHHKENGDWPR